MSRLLLALFAILALFASMGMSKPECPMNEVWDNCGTACPLTCDKPDPRPCTLQCIIGCRCKKGFVRDEKRRCIPREKCWKRDD